MELTTSLHGHSYGNIVIKVINIIQYMKYMKYTHTHTHTTDKTALEIVTQKLEELVKKEPTTPSTSIDPRLAVLDIHTASSSSSRTSSENEKEIEQLEDQFRGLEVKTLHHPTQTSLTKN